MDRKKALLIVAGAAITLLAITAVTASPRLSSTPLYTFRMEQASSNMNFLPTEQNQFVYTAESGYSLNYPINCSCCGGPVPLKPLTCNTCDEQMCEEPTECFGTCYSTCPGTCGTTCQGSTCDTCSGDTCDATSCQNTCSTCNQYTCYFWTCIYPTCLWETCYIPTCQDC